MSVRRNKVAVTPVPMTPGLHFVCAIFDFIASIPEELTLKVGDVIKVQKNVDNSWLQGLKLQSGEIGQFPQDFVKDVIIPKHSSNETLLYARDTFCPQANGDLPFDKGDIVVLERKIDNQWGTGRCGISGRGMFPLNYTDRLLPLTIASLGDKRHTDITKTKLEKNTSQNIEGLGTARAIMTLTAQLEDELSFCVDDEITILQVLENGAWYKGRLGDDTGTFPASFVQLLSPLKGTDNSDRHDSAPVQLSRTGSKAWKEENSDSVMIPNNVTNNNNNNNNLHSGNAIEENLTKLDVTDPLLHKFFNNEIIEEVLAEKIFSGATHPIVTTTESTAVTEDSCAEKKVLYTVITMHEFTGNTDQELSFDDGIEIPIFEEADDHWLLGKVDGKKGYVPRAYVSRKHSTPSEKEKILPKLDCNRSQRQKKSDKSDKNYVKAMGNGLVMKHHVYSAPKSQSSECVVNRNEAKKLDVGKKSVAIFDYEARNKFDLTIFTGDAVRVVKEVDKNWVEVKNEAGKTGIVPASYVQCITGADSRDTKPSSATSEQYKNAERQLQGGNGSHNSIDASSGDHPVSHAVCSTMPVLHEVAVSNGALADRNIPLSPRKPVISPKPTPKPVISPKPKSLQLNKNNAKRQTHFLQKSISVDSTNRDLPPGVSSSIDRRNSNHQSQYAPRERGTRPGLKAWQPARHMGSPPTGPSTPPNERSIQAECESNAESDNSVSKESHFSRTVKRMSMSVIEKRLHQSCEDTSVEKDKNFVRIRSDSDLRVGGERPRSSMGGNSRRLSKRFEHVNEDSSSTTSTGSSSSYGETRPSQPVHSDKSGSDASSAPLMTSATSTKSIRRCAPLVPSHAHSTTPSTPEPPQNTVYPPSPWSPPPPVPQRKRSLQHGGTKRGGDAEALSPETQRMAANPGSLFPSRPELPPNRVRPVPVCNEGSSPRKKVAPTRPANPPRARTHDPIARPNGGTQESVRRVTSRDMKDRLEKIRSDIEDYIRMKRELENLYQATLDGKERREISENVEFVKGNLRRLQKEFHDLIEGQKDHTYESIEQYMVKLPQDGTNSFERLPPPPLPPSSKSQDSTRIKRQERRRRVVKELVKTESDFLNDVTVTIEGIMNELAQQVPQTTISTLFSNIVQVKEFSEGLLKELKEALDNELSQQPNYDVATIGQVLIDNNPEMKEVYMPYYHNHDDAMSLLEKLQDDQDFMQAVNTCLDAIKNKVNVFDLGSFLIKPVQRFLKYPLLIEELIKLTDQSTRENPTDHDKLILAHKMMQDVAKEINEDKRVKDLVRKYKDTGNEGLSEKLSKISIKASKKKFSRLSTKIGRAAGISTQEKRDSKFDVESRKFKMMERAAKLFVNNVTSYCDKCRDVLCAELTVAHAVVDMVVVQPDRSHPVAMYQSMADKMSGPLYRQFHDQVQLQVLSPATSLIANFKSPQAIIDKRLDKLIDYERLQKHSDSKEKVEAAKHDYEALNKSLLDELPKLYDLGLKLLASCTAIFARIHRDFETKLLNELKPLLALIDQSGSNVPKIPGNAETYERFQPAYQEAIQTISRLQVIPASFTTLSGSSAKGSSEPQRKSRSSLSARPSETNSTLKQPFQDREGLKKKYDAGQLYVAEKNYSASQLMDVSCCEGDLVAVLKRQDPMGNTQRWFVNRGGPGNSNGFLPSALLKPYDPARDDTSMAFNSVPYSSSPQPSTPIPAPRNKSPTPSTRSSSSSTSGGSTKTPLSPYMLRETLKRGTLPSKEDGAIAPLTDTDILEAFAEEDEIFDDDFVYEGAVSTGTTIPKTSKQHFRAEYDFTARSELELTVRSGNIVKLILNHDTDGNPEWWLVSNGEGKQGYVPSNYLAKAEYL